jgi:lysozyme
MLSGQDISSFQGIIDWDTYRKNSNFAIIQATEGVGFTDPQFLRNQSEVRRVRLPHGFYHLCYPQLNQPQAEADYFLTTLKTIQEGEFLALDFEEGAAQPVAWAKAFLDYVSTRLNGYKPLIYMDLSHMNTYDWSPVVQAGYGLWLAQYNNTPDVTDPLKYWSVIAFHQWTNAQTVPGIPNKVDGDAFFGDNAALAAYGYKVTPPPVLQPNYQAFYTAIKDIIAKDGPFQARNEVNQIKALIQKMGV